jgi:hypothetical protein
MMPVRSSPPAPLIIRDRLRPGLEHFNVLLGLDQVCLRCGPLRLGRLQRRFIGGLDDEQDLPRLHQRALLEQHLVQAGGTRPPPLAMPP